MDPKSPSDPPHLVQQPNQDLPRIDTDPQDEASLQPKVVRLKKNGEPDLRCSSNKTPQKRNVPKSPNKKRKREDNTPSQTSQTSINTPTKSQNQEEILNHPMLKITKTPAHNPDPEEPSITINLASLIKKKDDLNNKTALLEEQKRKHYEEKEKLYKETEDLKREQKSLKRQINLARIVFPDFEESESSSDETRLSPHSQHTQYHSFYINPEDPILPALKNSSPTPTSYCTPRTHFSYPTEPNEAEAAGHQNIPRNNFTPQDPHPHYNHKKKVQMPHKNSYPTYQERHPLLNHPKPQSHVPNYKPQKPKKHSHTQLPTIDIYWKGHIISPAYGQLLQYEGYLDNIKRAIGYRHPTPEEAQQRQIIIDWYGVKLNPTAEQLRQAKGNLNALQEMLENNSPVHFQQRNETKRFYKERFHH